MADSINPYAPVDLQPAQYDDAATKVDFRITRSGLRHGEDHFLLHAHPVRLSISSLAMIFASGAAFVWSIREGRLAFWGTALLAMGLSTAIYLALVHRTKIKVRKKLKRHGLLRDTACSVIAEDDRLVMTGSSGHYGWHKRDVRIYRTPLGTLYCPEPHFFIYVPRNNNSPAEAYRNLRVKMADDASKDSPHSKTDEKQSDFA